MTDCRQDPKIRELIERFGHWGYSIYWHLIETVGQIGDGDSEIEITVKTLESNLGEKWSKLLPFFKFAGSKRLQDRYGSVLFTCTKRRHFVTVSIPTMAKIQDNYTKKRRTFDVQTTSQEVEEEKE